MGSSRARFKEYIVLSIMSTLDLFTSTLQSKVILGVGALATLIKLITHFSVQTLLFSLCSYGGLAFNAGCLTRGGCGTWAWITLIIPVISTVLYIVSATKKQAEEL